MNLLDQFEVLEIDKNMLTDKKQQTDYKIKYVSEYAKLWSIISAERNDVTEITFIDCMCNAGVYRDGDCCTAIEVFSLFKEAAQLHKNKTYNLYLNDIDSNRISCINKVIQYLNDDVVENLKVYTNNSLKIVRRLSEENIPCSILTKGILPRELANCSKKNEYGITIVTLDEEYRKIAEPGAASIRDRIGALRYLKEKGYKTWVSIEPFPTPNIHAEDLMDILEAVSFVDKIIFGRLHYNKKVSEYKNYKEYYNKCAEKVISFCEKNDIEYHIKNGTISEL